MHLLTDENIARSVVKALRKAGHSVKDIKEENLTGITDKEVLEIAHQENRIIVTHDKDFLNLPRAKIPKHPGIILLRFSDQKPKNVTEKFLKIIHSKTADKFKNAVSIISDKYIEIIKSK